MENTQRNIGYMEHALTRRMESVTNSLKQKYTSLYNRRDFVNRIKYLSRCSKDEASAVKVALSSMFEKCGINSVNVDGTPEYYMHILDESDIPTPSQMTHSVYESFLKEFTENPFPLPEEYIERMVDGKIDERWGNDSLRVKILKKFVRDAGYLAVAGYSEGYIKSYAKKKTGKKTLTLDEIIESIDEEIFKSIEDEDEIYREATANLVERREELKKLSKARKEELENIVEKKEGKKKKELKREIEGALRGDKIYSEYQNKLEDVRAQIDNEKKKKKQKTNNKGKLGLLKIADDLASGRFGNPDVVREEIYLFAIVFELTYFTGDPEEIVTEETKVRNIETVMFGDYYANNLMRYISGKHTNIKRGGEVQDPSGRGINYKNYMEVIFLYYLRRVDLSVIERLEGVYSMAKNVYDLYKANSEEEKPRVVVKESMSQFYTESFKSLDLEDEEEFIDYLVNNYDCSTPPNKTPVFSIEAEQRTAVKEYKLLLEDVYEFGVEEEDFANSKIAFLEDEMDVDKVRELQRKCENGKLNFDELDEKTKFDILLYEVKRNLGKRKNEDDLDKGIVTRADILRLYYHIYINDYSAEDDSSLRSFSDVYDDFSDVANVHLTDACLRPITGRDLYDLILIYSAYCNVNADKLMNF